MTKVYLGGTCNNSNWREKLIPDLKINYFNPVVHNWNNEAKLREIDERKKSDYCLYVITPLITGFYAIAEVVDDSNKKPKQTILCILNEDQNKTWSKSQKHSLDSVKKIVESNGAYVFNNLKETKEFLNKENKN